MTRNTPIPEISISRCTFFTSGSEVDYSQYEITVMGEGYATVGQLTFEDTTDLFRLRDAIDNYIKLNNLEKPTYEQKQ